ncbi:MAG: hypothetical protein E7812_17815 [Phenylobacterium sp.]|nr:MAG: hypothetical protein E7812_17815 [Phenylobacterium sp.]
MSIKTILIAGLAAIPLSLGAIAPAFAAPSCTKADRCDPVVCRMREPRVAPACSHAQGPTNCHHMAATAANRDELQLRLLRNQRCIKAGEELYACFSNPGPVSPSVQEARTSLSVCQRRLSEIR